MGSIQMPGPEGLGMAWCLSSHSCMLESQSWHSWTLEGSPYPNTKVPRGHSQSNRLVAPGSVSIPASGQAVHSTEPLISCSVNSTSQEESHQYTETPCGITTPLLLQGLA